jgi:CBS domain containing-hemolysin-like protein
MERPAQARGVLLVPQGCSRVPVYEGRRDNIVGLLFVKDLILVDADDEMEVATIMAFRWGTGMRHP